MASSKGVLVHFVPVHNKSKTRVGDRRYVDRVFMEYSVLLQF